MNKYIVTEKLTLNSHRNGQEIDAGSLAEAKRHAADDQMFQGTVMTVSDHYGNLLAYLENGQWTDIEHIVPTISSLRAERAEAQELRDAAEAAHKANPTPETRAAWHEAGKRHDKLADALYALEKEEEARRANDATAWPEFPGIRQGIHA